jgi:hypothetical protein
MTKLIDLTNKHFGNWLVLERNHEKHKGTHWICKCSCGAKRSVSSINLSFGKSTSCGCTRKRTIKHGGSKSRIYKIWAGMIQRCTNPNRQCFKNYGARGIYVCDRWMEFKNFMEDMGDPPAAYSLDRINNDGPYEPSNCRWANDCTQARNSRNTKLTEHGAFQIVAKSKEGMTKAALAREFGVSESLIRAVVQGEVWKKNQTVHV